jgi:hypothetical protein
MSRVRLFANRALIAVAVVLVVAYACDYIYFRVRLIHPKLADPLETFTVPRLYAIAVKGNKTDYELDEQNPVQTLVCVHSLFPHAGSGPCWYVKPKSQQPIPM